jgi:DDE superfamily endonuclease
MDFSTLTEFRRKTYDCFTRAKDALMNVVDALLTETPARSLAELSLSPCFERHWSSLYEAFQDGAIERTNLQKLFAEYVPEPNEGERLVVGGDASSILRIESKTARDRTYVHASNLPKGVKPVRPGWQFSEVAVLPNERSSFVYVLDNRRIESTSTQGQVMAEQLKETAERLGRRFLFLGDGYYGSQIFRDQTKKVACDVLVRFAKNRVLYRQAPPPPEKPGRGHPTWHGAPLRLKDPQTHAQPDQAWAGTDQQEKKVEVRCWHHLHFATAHTQEVSLFQVVRHGAADTKRDPKVSWFLFWGEEPPPLAEIPTLYARRYNLEHAYRTAKQDLLWETPRLRTPEQFERWTDVVSVVRNTLFLARDLVEAQRQPWERECRARTPQQVRRAMGRIIAQLGTPARVCQRRGYSPGWQPGRSRQPAPTYKVVYKACEKTEKGAKPPSSGASAASVAA